MKLFAGASGYSFKEWRGTFYPADLKPDGMLAFYSARLPTVEINNTFYRMPRTEMLAQWAKTTPPTFRFAIKASRRITHFAHIKPEAADSVAFLYRSLAALGDKRGPVLFQLPPVLKKDVPRLAAFLQMLPPDHRAAFEFRNESWFADDVYELLQRAAAACRDGRLGVCAPAARDLRRRRSRAMGAPNRRCALGRRLRLLHARADSAGVCSDLDALCRFVEGCESTSCHECVIAELTVTHSQNATAK